MKHIISILILILIVCCCVPDKQQKKTDEKKDTIDSADSLNTGRDSIEILYSLPAIDEIVDLLKDAGLTYDESLLHPHENAGDYISARAQTLNLGVYLADLSYCAFFEKQQPALHYFSVVYDLAGKLKIDPAFDKQFINRVRENVNQIDSLLHYMHMANVDIVNYLVSNERENTLSLLIIGAFTESMYLAFTTTGNYSPDDELIREIAEQHATFEVIRDHMYTYKNDYLLAGLQNDIKEIDKVFEILEQMEQKGKNKQEKGKLVIGSHKTLYISESSFKKLKATINNFRNKIVNLE
jgi:hypothetical protein